MRPEDASCPACHGTIPCKGGGNKRCHRRDPRPSRIAAVLDTYGGIRFVVAYRRNMKHHARHDEVLIMVPRVIVHEPIVWGDLPGMTGRIEHEVTKWLQRGEPNEPHALEAWRMHKLRRLEQPRRALNLYDIVET